MSNFQAKILKKSDVWIVDGTFKSVPSQFEQLITLQGRYLGKFWPAGHALLVTKTEAAYSALFSQFKTLISVAPELF